IDVEAHHRFAVAAPGGGFLGGAFPALLADDARGGQQAAQLGDDDLLAGAVVLGDDVVVGGLVLTGEAVAVEAPEVLRRRVGGGQQVRGGGHGGGRGTGRRGVHPRQASPRRSAPGGWTGCGRTPAPPARLVLSPAGAAGTGSSGARRGRRPRARCGSPRSGGRAP